ncbi:MAG: sulfatase-like hydrolase/transferase [Candidatus Latescibacteria bacterium]|nr:sulfatase-like hydrolase/transferase [Candidatus Latescibacterota bacterium]
MEMHDKPNFVQILTDDQGWGDLGSFGHQFIQSPHLDRLAEEGLKFTHCYAADSVCSPARAAILTGRTPYRNGVYRWIPANTFCHLPKKEITLPQLLRSDGYQTAHFGKWHLGHFTEHKVDETEDWISTFGQAPDQPNMQDYGYDYWFATGNVARPNHENPQNFFLNGEAMGKMEGFSAQIVADQLVTWIRGHRKQDQPFFITVWFHEPHGPINSDPRFVQQYEELKDPSLRQYLANITQLDEAVGSVVKALKEAGVYDDTLVWYTSDNGPEGPHEYGSFNTSDSPYGRSRSHGSTGGLRGRKRHTHEGGIRVPGIISWPKGFKEAGVRPGGVCGEPVIGSDIFPTLLELAGLKPPDQVALDSSSIVPLLRNEAFERARPLYWRNCFQDFRIALRQGEWKILGNSKRTEFKLHNLYIDPRETSDLSAHEPALFESMKNALIQYDREVIAEGPDWWKREENQRADMPLE